MDLITFSRSVREGRLDDHLGEIAQAVNTRRKVIATETRGQLKVGKEYRLSGDIKPQYLRGLRVTVHRILQKKAECFFVDEHIAMARRFGSTVHPVRVPMTCLREVLYAGEAK